jgi:histidinol-phosphate aminotransferase
VPRREDFSLDLERVEQVALEGQPKLIFVTSPNNPDGGWLPDGELQRLLDLPLVVVLDEAYVEFAGFERSRIRWAMNYDNLIVLRTFSKWAGLAGLRVGYGAFPASIVDDLWKIKQPYGVSQAASAAGVAALRDLSWAKDKVARIVLERKLLSRLLETVPFLLPYPSRSNFILCRVLERDAVELKDALEREGVLVRYYRSPRLRDHIRISVGTPAQTDALMQVLRRI